MIPEAARWVRSIPFSRSEITLAFLQIQVRVPSTSLTFTHVFNCNCPTRFQYRWISSHSGGKT